MSTKNLQDTLDDMDAARVKFVGMAVDTLKDPPDLYEEIECTVKGTVVGYSLERMKDGEERLVAKVEVDSIRIGEQDVKQPAQPTLPEADGDGADDPGF